MFGSVLLMFGLYAQAAYSTTLGKNGHGIENANDGQKMTLSSEYLKHQAPGES
jgi:hypothetical protein